MEHSQPFDESKVLIIYTGGTIGMLVGHQGYVPEPYFLTETLFSQHRFHDPLEESLFSHSSSVEGFRTWSGRASPATSTFTSRASSPSPGTGHHQLSTLPVRSSRPIGTPLPLAVSVKSQSSQLRHPSCRKISEDVYEAHLHSLVTPRTTTHGSNSKRIRYVILEVWRPTFVTRALVLISYSGIHCSTAVTWK
jgi:60kDa lysophospholipase